MHIAISGVDGSGKTALSTRLAAALRALNISASVSCPNYQFNGVILEYCERHFGDPFAYGRAIPPDYYVTVLATDWYAWLLQEEERVLSTNHIVCSDRYVLDILAQGLATGAHMDLLMAFLTPFPQPDLTVYLNLPVELADRRLSLRRHPPRHSSETMTDLVNLVSAYTACFDALPGPKVSLTASDPLEIVLSSALQEALDVLGYVD